MSTNIEIRSAHPEELETLLAFEQGVIEAERPFDATLDDRITYYDLAALIESEDAEVVVAVLDGQLVGSGFAKIVTSKPYLRFKQHSYLGFMYVHPDHRGKGINQKVIQALLDWSATKGMTEVRLEVYSGNSSAIRAYEKTGFSKNLVEMRRQVTPTNNKPTSGLPSSFIAF